MEILSSTFLGIIQGLTEFLPISSSGHLIIVREFLNLQVEYGLAFDAVLQLATTLAIIVYFKKTIFRLIFSFFNLILKKNIEPDQKSFIFAIFLATLPAIFFGLLLEDYMDLIFRNVSLVAISLILGGLFMYVSENYSKKRILEKNNSKINVFSGLKIGFYQSLALIPGMSRSGMSIAGGLFCGLSREDATKFSFIIAIPILLGSGIKKLIELVGNGVIYSVGFELLVGFLVSFFVGLLAIHFLVRFLKKHTLKIFVWYRFLLAIIILIIF